MALSAKVYEEAAKEHQAEESSNDSDEKEDKSDNVKEADIEEE